MGVFDQTNWFACAGNTGLRYSQLTVVSMSDRGNSKHSSPGRPTVDEVTNILSSGVTSTPITFLNGTSILCPTSPILAPPQNVTVPIINLPYQPQQIQFIPAGNMANPLYKEPEPDWNTWTTDQKREWLRKRGIKGVHEKNLNQKCSSVWSQMKNGLSPLPTVNTMTFSPGVAQYLDEPDWSSMSTEELRQFLKQRNVKGVWEKHLAQKCSEVWRLEKNGLTYIHGIPAHERLAMGSIDRLSPPSNTTDVLVTNRLDSSMPQGFVPPSALVSPTPTNNTSNGIEYLPREFLKELIAAARSGNLKRVSAILDEASDIARRQKNRAKRERPEDSSSYEASSPVDSKSELESPKRQKQTDSDIQPSSEDDQRIQEDSQLKESIIERLTRENVETKRALELLSRDYVEKLHQIESQEREITTLREQVLALQRKNEFLQQRFSNIMEVMKALAPNNPVVSTVLSAPEEIDASNLLTMPTSEEDPKSTPTE